LELPDGWGIEGALNYDFTHAVNYMAERFKGDYLFFLDDDNAFHPTVLKRLLAHNLDVVGALYFERKPPFAPMPRRYRKPLLLHKPGLCEVDETGTSGLLVHRRVFDRLEQPWFVSGDNPDGTYTSPDYYFCGKAREAGFRVWVDTSVWLAHYNVLRIMPDYNGDGWTAKLSVGNHDIVRFARNQGE